jgi:outer membrane protein OmpA-like peptidoglycan-associated protein
MAFGTSLLGIATASCVPEQRSAPSATPTSGIRGRSSVSPAPKTGASGIDRAPTPPDPDPPRSVVAIYGGPSVAIHSQIEYSHGSLVIDAEGERTLVALKELLAAFECDIVIQGHAGRDEAKTAEWLSKRRAENVRDRLIALGVDGERLSVEALGTSRPRAGSPAAPARDRRVSFAFHARPAADRQDCRASDRR